MKNPGLQFLLPVFFVIGFLTRLLLLKNVAVTKLLANRIEISTPISSWKRAVEGISLSEKGINPYDGDIFHESPLSLDLYKYINDLEEHKVCLVFAVCEVLTAAVLALSAALYLKSLARRENVEEKYDESATVLLVRYEQLQVIPHYVALIYLFCPFAIAACCGKSTVVFLNLLISIFLFLALAGRWFEASAVLGVMSYHSFYHLSLLVPLIMLIVHNCKHEKLRIIDFCRIILVVFVFVATMSVFLYISYQKTGSWQFLASTYGFALSVPDLTPNIGLFWYFFTEMFEHFRVFFLWTFQLNAFIYTVPLAIRLRKEPVLLLFVHLMIIALFKSYPSIGDVVVYLSLLPIWGHLFLFMRQSFLVGCGLVICSFLAPTLWHLWIYCGSANANFYFAITLAFNTGQIFLLTDVLSAYVKREYYLLNGIKTDSEGKLLLLRLQ